MFDLNEHLILSTNKNSFIQSSCSLFYKKLSLLAIPCTQNQLLYTILIILRNKKPILMTLILQGVKYFTLVAHPLDVDWIPLVEVVICTRNVPTEGNQNLIPDLFTSPPALKSLREQPHQELSVTKFLSHKCCKSQVVIPNILHA